jgi:hypothetical protein
VGVVIASAYSWCSAGFFYSNPTNHMWRCLKEAKFIPSTWPMSRQMDMPSSVGVGFVDVGTDPGSNAAEFSHAELRRWRRSFYERLSGHVQRVREGRQARAEPDDDAHCVPLVCAFAGKRQFQ